LDRSTELLLLIAGFVVLLLVAWALVRSGREPTQNQPNAITPPKIKPKVEAATVEPATRPARQSPPAGLQAVGDSDTASDPSPLRTLPLPPIRSPEEMSTSTGSEGYLDLNFRIPDMPNDTPATDKQKATVRAVMTGGFDADSLTKGQASLILDASSYVNGVLALMKMAGSSNFSSTANEVLVKLIGVEAILNDDEICRGVSAWGRDMYNLGRAAHVPDLDPDSDLFKKVFFAITNRATLRAGDIRAND
jgi:hypothetical protein